MGDAATMARAVALLGVLVDSNDGPDMIEIDTKELLFNSALRLEPNNMLALLCARLGVPPPATLRRSGPQKETGRGKSDWREKCRRRKWLEKVAAVDEEAEGEEDDKEETQT